MPATQVPGSWHWSGAAQVIVLAGVQTPVWQVSPEVHMLLSLQEVPLATTGFRHMPVPGSQVPTV